MSSNQISDQIIDVKDVLKNNWELGEQLKRIFEDERFVSLNAAIEALPGLKKELSHIVKEINQDFHTEFLESSKLQ